MEAWWLGKYLEKELVDKYICTVLMSMQTGKVKKLQIEKDVYLWEQICLKINL